MSETPTPMPTQTPRNTTFAPTLATTQMPSESPTTPPTVQNTAIEIIRLPSYKGKDPVDSIFMVIVILTLLVILGSCLRSIKRSKSTLARLKVRKDIGTELSMNAENGSDEIDVVTRDYRE